MLVSHYQIEIALIEERLATETRRSKIKELKNRLEHAKKMAQRYAQPEGGTGEPENPTR